VEIITEIGVFIRGEKLQLVNFEMLLLSRKRQRKKRGLGAYVYNALEKIPTNIFMSFSSKLHVEHNQRGMGGQFLRPISQELCYIKVPWKS
jgi:hypothetical protein